MRELRLSVTVARVSPEFRIRLPNDEPQAVLQRLRELIQAGEVPTQGRDACWTQVAKAVLRRKQPDDVILGLGQHRKRGHSVIHVILLDKAGEVVADSDAGPPTNGRWDPQHHVYHYQLDTGGKMSPNHTLEVLRQTTVQRLFDEEITPHSHKGPMVRP